MPEAVGTIAVGAWLVLDAVLDNAIAVAVQSGESDDVIERASRLRERGWQASAAHPLSGRGSVGWPPEDAGLALGLTAVDRRFLRTQIDDAIDVTRRLLASPELPPVVRLEQQDSLDGLVEAQRVLALDKPGA